MKFHQNTAELFIPDGSTPENALRRTTHMAISAHLDDIEIMAVEPILRCFQQPDFWFSAVVMSDGRGSPRDDLYKNYSDDEMRVVRIKEQKKSLDYWRIYRSCIAGLSQQGNKRPYR
jgi:hypothetical protein